MKYQPHSNALFACVEGVRSRVAHSHRVQYCWEGWTGEFYSGEVSIAMNSGSGEGDTKIYW